MDHAAWAQSDIANAKHRLKQSRSRKYRIDITKGYEAAPDKLNAFQRSVFDIVGMVGGGIYNAPISWDAIRWKGWGHGIAIPWKRGHDLSTFDFNTLTKLVFLCHEARIRCEIRSNGFHGLLLCFWPRKAEGCVATRHPNLEEAVTSFREYLGDDHPIVYREPAEVEA
ncbi:hypothetical protein [Paraburkholderia tropica]|uniref:hypothetical protein n=1 Tax=Paraburkholderia tropica TaxID=92647 RepID=UPI001ABC20DE|nr:hypothetical protein [Paraburkholderia tropica]